jgi:hypothetical protein
MKSTANLLFTLILLGFIISCSHSGETIFTKINANGTCFREVTAKADSAFMVGDTVKNNPFTIHRDSTWELSWQTEGSEKQYNWPLKVWKPDSSLTNAVAWVTLKKHFASVDELSANFHFQDGVWDSIHSQASLNKRFRWFVTYFDYTENFPKLKNIERYPIRNFLSYEEILLYFQGNTGLLKGLNGIEMKDLLQDIDTRKEKWLFRNLFEIQYDIILKNFNLFPDKSISKLQLDTMKNTIIKCYQDSDINSNNDVYKMLDIYFKTSKFSELCEKNEHVLIELNKASEFSSYFKNEYNYKLIMPGKVIESNGVSLNGDTLSWKVNAYRFAFIDYKMAATSRTINIWACVLTGFIIGIAVFIGVRKIRKNKDL